MPRFIVEPVTMFHRTLDGKHRFTAKVRRVSNCQELSLEYRQTGTNKRSVPSWDITQLEWQFLADVSEPIGPILKCQETPGKELPLHAV
jgi:hypothetical protein